MAARPTSVRRTASRKPERVIRSPDALDARRTARGSQPTRRPRERERRTVRERIVDAGYNARVTACRHRLERTTTAPTAAVERHPGCGGTTAATPACVDPTYSRRGDDAAARERHRPSLRPPRSGRVSGMRPSDRRGPGPVGHRGRNVRSIGRCSYNLRITRHRAASCDLHRSTSRVIHRSGCIFFMYHARTFLIIFYYFVVGIFVFFAVGRRVKKIP